MAFDRNSDKIKKALEESQPKESAEKKTAVAAEQKPEEKKGAKPKLRFDPNSEKYRKINDSQQAKNIRVFNETHAKISFIARTLKNVTMYDLVEDMINVYAKSTKLTQDQKDAYKKVFPK